MSTVAEIKAAISKLAPQDFAQVRDRLLERDALLWDKPIKEDAAAERLAHIVAEIEGEITAGIEIRAALAEAEEEFARREGLTSEKVRKQLGLR